MRPESGRIHNFRHNGTSLCVQAMMCATNGGATSRSLDSGKGAAVFADELSAAPDSSMGSITTIFGSKHCLN